MHARMHGARHNDESPLCTHCVIVCREFSLGNPPELLLLYEPTLRLENEFIPLSLQQSKQTESNRIESELYRSMQTKTLFLSTTYMKCEENIGNRCSQPAMPLPNTATTCS
jgi:hypothetical protein